MCLPMWLDYLEQDYNRAQRISCNHNEFGETVKFVVRA